MKFSNRIGTFLFAIVALSACDNGIEPEKARPMIYEGMPKSELRKILGEPLEIDSSGSILDVNRNRKVVLEKWSYENRTVLLINDTVKSANFDNRGKLNSGAAD